MFPSLTLIVVTHNSARWLPGIFETWRRAVTSLPVEIVIADAGSADDTLRLAAAFEPSARILPCGNIGYGAAANRAAAQSTAPWILLCNSDVEFPDNFEPDFLRSSLDAPPAEAGCIAPALLNDDNSPQHSVGNFPTITSIVGDQFRPRAQRKYILNPTGKFFDWATGAVLLVRREHWNAVGGFDEKFFLYVEEVDFQRRLAALGLRTLFLNNVHVRHLAPHATRPNPQVQKYSARGLLRYFAKHGTPAQLLAFRAIALLTARLSPREAFAKKQNILHSTTGP